MWFGPLPVQIQVGGQYFAEPDAAILARCAHRALAPGSSAPDQANNFLSLAFGVCITGLVICGSMLIMTNLNHNMMSMDALMKVQPVAAVGTAERKLNGLRQGGLDLLCSKGARGVRVTPCGAIQSARSRISSVFRCSFGPERRNLVWHADCNLSIVE